MDRAPSWAVWVPAGTAHAIRFGGESALRTLYLRPGWAEELPADCTAATVSPLLRELVLRTVAVGLLRRRDPVEAALAILIVDAFRSSSAPPFELPRPESEKLRRAAAALAQGTATTAAIARSIGQSRRTFERRFLTETGMSPDLWRRHALLLGAVERLAGGAPVKAVAAAAGYASPSAFVAAFRKRFGITPSRYFEAR